VCPGSACGGNVFCPSADPHRRVFMCVDCVNDNWSNIELARKPSASHRYPLHGHALDLVDNGTECSVCEKVFTFWRRPHSCSECESDVCVACSDGDISSQILGITRSRVCKPCMPGIKTRIEERGAEDPRLDVKKELLLIDKSIETEPVDEGETWKAGEWRSKHKPPVVGVAVAAASKDDHCSVCHKAYGVFRKRKSCSNCEGAVCASCSHEFKLPSLGWTEQRRICDPCLPTISAQLDKVNATVAAKKQWQKDRHSVMQLMGGNAENNMPQSSGFQPDASDDEIDPQAGKDGGEAVVAAAPAASAKVRPKIAPLNLAQATGGGSSSNVVTNLLSPRYVGPISEPDPLNPGKMLDWSVILGKDVHKESQKSVEKKKLAEISRMREALLLAQRKYTAELSFLENREMKAFAEEQKQWLTLRLLEAQGLSDHGASFFLAVGDSVAPSSAWSSPFHVRYARQLEVRLLTESNNEIGKVSLHVERIQPEELDSGATLSLQVGNEGVVKISVKTGKGLK